MKRKIQNEAELAECTFTPNILYKRRSLSCKSKENSRLTVNTDFYEKGIQWKNEIENKNNEVKVYKHLKKILNEKIMLENCPFRPTISKKSKEMITNECQGTN